MLGMAGNKVMYSNLVMLADISYHFRIIGLAEYEERLKVAAWIFGGLSRDPRDDFSPGHVVDDLIESEEGASFAEASVIESAGGGPEDPLMRLVVLGRWLFTKGDRDCYPSVPHGHLGSKTNEWPKLNPYSGRVFDQPHRENPNARLNKNEMKALWNDTRFIEHCRDQIVWYGSFSPSYAFPRARKGRFIFPKW